ncbi:tyrosine-protein phosphatase non-receptor type substrate 1-like isoform X4 [Alligator sinensis]|uniref:Tyrosine-protein phosphatase non-receptor type substrate 1-like isoform X4 n=1 Tax=Alligator sinensis TaxID=38654 RepID=A0A3Q0GCV6_ALLSI|nr:tyrosine-protein phosphatase non-receptor type substrate 1-like isoform X4 [Alligator sinensis]
MQLFSLTLGLALLGSSGGGGQDFQVLQPWPSAQASAGETLMLNCTVTKRGLPGPVKWLKGSGSNHQLIYAEIGSFPRVTRAVPSSVSDYSIHISDIRPEDAGTYYCVKFKKEPPDEEYQRGTGTVVSVGGLQPPHQTPPVVPTSPMMARTRTSFTQSCCTSAGPSCPRRARWGSRPNMQSSRQPRLPLDKETRARWFAKPRRGTSRARS